MGCPLEAIGGAGGSGAKQHAPGGPAPTLSRLAPTFEDYSGKLLDWGPAHGQREETKSRKGSFLKCGESFNVIRSGLPTPSGLSIRRPTRAIFCCAHIRDKLAILLCVPKIEENISDDDFIL